MPKVRDTRKQRAQRLLQLAEGGPSFSIEIPNWPFQESPSHDYRLWARSWLIPLIKELVPELKEKKTL